MSGKPAAGGKGKGKQPRAVTLASSELSAGLSLKDLHYAVKTLAISWDPKTLGHSDRVVLTCQDGSCTAMIEVTKEGKKEQLSIADFNVFLLADSKPYLNLGRAASILMPLLSDPVGEALKHSMENLTSHTEIDDVLSTKVQNMVISVLGGQTKWTLYDAVKTAVRRANSQVNAMSLWESRGGIKDLLTGPALAEAVYLAPPGDENQFDEMSPEPTTTATAIQVASKWAVDDILKLTDPTIKSTILYFKFIKESVAHCAAAINTELTKQKTRGLVQLEDSDDVVITISGWKSPKMCKQQ
eukprot:5268521-Amphidinium_carterae.1